jgi:NAD(P)-dependent dehydrogenase (short-subunit alcohol dehydrogenase family)
MANLNDKVGIVTGGGTGIGRATALAMARAGAIVVIGNRDAAKGKEVVALIRQAGGRALFQKTDVSKPGDVKGLVDKAVAEFGRLDAAFNNAGIDGQQVSLHEQDIDKAGVLFDVNIKGVFYSMKYEIEQMLKTGGGSIVNTSSIFGLNGYPGRSLYVATKHAVTGMTKAAALDYAKRNVRVRAVGPGPVETPLLAKGTGGDPHSDAAFVPMGRIGQPDEIAKCRRVAAVRRSPLRHRPHPARRWRRVCRVAVTTCLSGHLHIKGVKTRKCQNCPVRANKTELLRPRASTPAA